ncbi:hypothetical protein [Francisella philomiragia]|uniref:hypothetical protein n=1 Tax=Francisella philomiragia TaxID=28110 RepID=UPI0035191780
MPICYVDESAHSLDMPKIIYDVGHIIEFLPPYSPDLRAFPKKCVNSLTQTSEFYLQIR